MHRRIGGIHDYISGTSVKGQTLFIQLDHVGQRIGFVGEAPVGIGARLRQFPVDDHQQIGELATHVSEAYIAAHGEVPWKQIKGMRTWFAHQYWDMSFDMIWVTLTEDVPDLRSKLEKAVRTE